MITKEQILAKYISFRKKYLGVGVNWDGKFGKQCVDLYRAWCNHLGYKQSPPVKGAKDIATTYDKTCFKRLTNWRWFIPQAGDVAIYEGTYGHVDIVDDRPANLLKFFSLTQNWYEGGTTLDGKGTAYIIQHNYLKPKIICFLRPIK